MPTNLIERSVSIFQTKPETEDPAKAAAALCPSPKIPKTKEVIEELRCELDPLSVAERNLAISKITHPRLINPTKINVSRGVMDCIGRAILQLEEHHSEQPNILETLETLREATYLYTSLPPRHNDSRLKMAFNTIKGQIPEIDFKTLRDKYPTDISATAKSR